MALADQYNDSPIVVPHLSNVAGASTSFVNVHQYSHSQQKQLHQNQHQKQQLQQQQDQQQNNNNISTTSTNDEPNKIDHIIAAKTLSLRIKEDNRNDELYFERAICYHNIENFKESLKDIDSAIFLNQTNYDYFYQKGLTLFALNKVEEGVRAFKKAIELRAKQEDSKLSDIFRLLDGAIKEVKNVRRRKSYTNSPADSTQPNAVSSNRTSSSNQAQPTELPLNSQILESQPQPKPANQKHTFVATTTTTITENLASTSASSLQHSVISMNGQTTESLECQNFIVPQEKNPVINQQILMEPTYSQASPTSSSSFTKTIDNVKSTEDKHDDDKIKKVVVLTKKTKIHPRDELKANKDFVVLCRSAKYKRIKRDRERARRGCSEQCRMSVEDIEKFKRSRKPLKVIAPIDGWLYNGEVVSLDSNLEGHYVIKLDGDESKTSYVFNHDSLLKDVIKEVKIESVTDLRKGARICCFWSRQHKCLTTGVVTSRTFNETKSLVSVKYDNGDLSALPIEDLRLLPPDYPKFFSNNEPLQFTKKRKAQIDKTAINDSGQKVRTYSAESKKLVKNDNNPTCSSSSELKKLDESKTASSKSEYDFDESNNEVDSCNDLNSVSTPNMDGSGNLDDFNRNDTPQLVLQNLSQEMNETIETKVANVASVTNYYPTSDVICGGIEYRPWIFEHPIAKGKRKKCRQVFYKQIRRGMEIISIGDSAELMPKDASILPFVAKIESFWATYRGEMKVRVRWYYRAIETNGEQLNLVDVDNALFETKHCDENDVQSIYKTALILPWSEYRNNHVGHTNVTNDQNSPKIFYHAGYYNPVSHLRQLSDDVKNDLID